MLKLRTHCANKIALYWKLRQACVYIQVFKFGNCEGKMCVHVDMVEMKDRPEK